MAQKERERERESARCYEPNRARFDFLFFFAGGVRIRVMLVGNVNMWIFMHTCMLD